MVKKDDAGKLVVRSRLVGRDFKVNGERDREDLFTAMLPLEVKKLLFRMAASMNKSRARRGLPELKLMFIDVKKAHLNSSCDEVEFVYLPSEFAEFGSVARLRRWLYGMRPAGKAWEEHYAQRLQEAGFARGVAAPTLFRCKATGVRVVVHGDDFAFLGTHAELVKMKDAMSSWYEIKFRGIMGSDSEDLREVTILGRTLGWTKDGIELEADARHRVELLAQFGLNETSNALTSPVIRETDGLEEGILDPEEATKYRAGAARLNYYGLDRPDVQFAAKEICKDMSRPTPAGLRKLKRVARYLVGAARMVWMMPMDDEEAEFIDVYADSDWAGDRSSRKSTSGGMLTVGGVAVTTWSRTQRIIATSVGEAEYYAMVTAAAEALGLQAIAEDLGWSLRIRLRTDSSTAKAIGSSRGLGSLCHLETKMLWLQQAAQQKRLKLDKIPGKVNPADALTKPLPWNELEYAFARVGGTIHG